MFFAANRNTNYFGEILLYSSFAVLVNRWEAFALLCIVWGTVFVGRIYQKEMSLMKKEGWENYEKRSYLILFKVFANDAMNVAFYVGIVAISYYFYSIGGVQAFL